MHARLTGNRSEAWRHSIAMGAWPADERWALFRFRQPLNAM